MGSCRFIRGLHQVKGQWTQFRNDIRCTFDKLGALPNKLMTATRHRIMY